jgi:hypothetical protein
MNVHTRIALLLLAGALLGSLAACGHSAQHSLTKAQAAQQYSQLISTTLAHCQATYECGPHNLSAFLHGLQQLAFPPAVSARRQAVANAAAAALAAARRLLVCHVGCVRIVNRYHRAIVQLVRADAALRHALD